MTVLRIAAATGAMLAGISFTASLQAQATQRLPNDSLEIGRRYAAWLLTGQVDSLAAHMSPGALKNLGGRDGLTQRAAEIAARAGQEVSVVEERFAWRNGQRQYWRSMNMTALSEPLLVRIVLGSQGDMTGLGLGLASGAPPADSGGPPIRKP